MKVIKDLSYTPTPHPSRVLDIYLPDSDTFSVFLYFHGGGLEAGDKIDGELLATYLVPRNVAVVSANYRMYPEASCPDYYKDAAAAAAWVKKNMSQYGNITAYYMGGSSAGANLTMMLCYAAKYLAPHGIRPEEFDGYVHDAGQPTVHYNILRERGIDKRRVIIDEDCAIYHIGTSEAMAPQLVIYSDNDIQNRPEQNILLLSTLRHFGYDQSKIFNKIMHGTHCEYVGKRDENGDSILGKAVWEFIEALKA